MSYGRARPRAVRTTLGPRGRGVAMWGMGALGATAAAPDLASSTTVEGVADYVARTWHPTGYYTPDQMASILSQCETLYLSVVTPIRAYIAGDLNFAKDVAHALDNRMNLEGYQKFVLTNQRYVREARTAGAKYLNAPGFRAATISFLYLMSNGVDGLAMIQRVNEEEWSRLPMAREILTVSRAAATAIVKVAGIAYDVAKAAGAAVLAIPDTARTIYTVLKWGSVAYLAYWLYEHLRVRHA